jgi:hypothetical protein
LSIEDWIQQTRPGPAGEQLVYKPHAYLNHRDQLQQIEWVFVALARVPCHVPCGAIKKISKTQELLSQSCRGGGHIYKLIQIGAHPARRIVWPNEFSRMTKNLNCSLRSGHTTPTKGYTPQTKISRLMLCDSEKHAPPQGQRGSLTLSTLESSTRFEFSSVRVHSSEDCVTGIACRCAVRTLNEDQPRPKNRFKCLSSEFGTQ